MSDRPRPASGASPLQPRTPEFPYWRASQATPSSDGLQGVYPAYHALDDRASSAVSLRPSISEEAETRRRILLMIYIHGYMGNDASFHSFPAHVHNLLKRTLAHTHVVHTKIYPRYKTYKAMDIARDNFSAWLQPHESSTTDVILVGHSMGGLLAAEAVLIPGLTCPPFRHRILGTISLDSPFLGLHPGIISTGIASLFRPDPESREQPSPSSPPPPSTLSASPSPDPSIISAVSREDLTPSDPSASPSMPDGFAPDPHFNPPFFNDVLFRDRGRLKNLLHFANKNGRHGLLNAAQQHLMSHLEYGGCLLDYPSLNSRYERLRRLENPLHAAPRRRGGAAMTARPPPPRVRFANYYTVTTGRAKTPRSAPPPASSHAAASESPTVESRMSSLDIRSTTPTAAAATNVTTGPRISDENGDSGGNGDALQFIEPTPVEEEGEGEGEGKEGEGKEGKKTTAAEEKGGEEAEKEEKGEFTSSSPKPDSAEDGVAPGNAEPVDPPDAPQLPEVPGPPDPPEIPELDPDADAAARKEAEREAKKLRKAYEESVKQRNRIIKKRQKLIEQHEKNLRKEAEKREKAALKEARRKEKQDREEQKKEALAVDGGAETGEGEEDSRPRQQQGQQQGAAKKKKDRKFCMLPRDVAAGRDATWIPVRMDGLDEVASHCALFLPGPHYDALVGDVAMRIVAWFYESRPAESYTGSNGNEW